jgi:deoxyribonuclease-4
MATRKITGRPKIGFHAPIKGGLHESLIVAKDIGCDAVQIFSRNPRGWLAKPLTKEAIDLFRKTRKQTKLSPVLIHTNYLINLAAADEVILLKSIASFREEVERAILLGVDYLVLHPGSARGSSESDAIKICALSLKLACKGLEFGRLRILLENTAGQGQCIGNRFEHLRAIMDACPELPLGVCVDTAHSFTAGYDIREADGLEATLEIIRRTVRLRNCARCISTIHARHTTRASIVTGTSAKVTLGAKPCDALRSILSWHTPHSSSKRRTMIRARI